MPPEAADPPRGRSETALNLAGLVLAAVGGSIGVLSFVAFVGAAVLWTRLETVGIPANEAVAVVPKSVLVTTGASTLVWPLLVALLFVFLLCLIDMGGRLWAFHRVQGAGKKAADALAEMERTRAYADEATANIEQITERSQWRRRNVRMFYATGVDAETLRRASDREGAAMASAVAAVDEAQLSASQAYAKLTEARRAADRAWLAKKSKIERGRRNARSFLSLVVLIGASYLAIETFSAGLPAPHRWCLIGITTALISACLLILWVTKFAWFVVATFVAVMLVSGVLDYFRTSDIPKVEPAAVLRSHGPPVFGFFVAQTSDRIYLGTTVPTGAMRLDAIPREEIADMTVGSPQPADSANRLGRHLAFQICHLAREREHAAKLTKRNKSAHSKVADGELCTSSDMHVLHPEGST